VIKTLTEIFAVCFVVELLSKAIWLLNTWMERKYTTTKPDSAPTERYTTPYDTKGNCKECGHETGRHEGILYPYWRKHPSACSVSMCACSGLVPLFVSGKDVLSGTQLVEDEHYEDYLRS
jgi:hypothetical protein